MKLLAGRRRKFRACAEFRKGEQDWIGGREGSGDRPPSRPFQLVCGQPKGIVSVQPSHLPNSSIKGDGVRVFLSRRDSPYRRDFHAPTKLLPQTVQGPGCSGVPATRCDRFQRCHPPRHQCQRHSQVATALSRSTASGVAGVRSCESYAKTTS